ncbi:hypothetical protein VTK56DRAFT_8096 [Thermocarpiscus australiensis]
MGCQQPLKLLNMKLSLPLSFTLPKSSCQVHIPWIDQRYLLSDRIHRHLETKPVSVRRRTVHLCRRNMRMAFKFDSAVPLSVLAPFLRVSSVFTLPLLKIELAGRTDPNS